MSSSVLALVPAPKLDIRWVEVGGTHVLFQENNDNLVTEWRIVGFTILRQIYAQRPPMWAVFLGKERHFPVADFESLAAARKRLEMELE